MEASDGVAGDKFGSSVDISANRIIVGATEAWKTTTDPATDFGMAYIFERKFYGNFTEEVKLEPDPAFAPARASFGGATAIDGNRGES